MEDYVEIKVKDLKEGQRFWRCLSDVGGATVERVIRDGVEVWADGEKWNCGIPQPNETVYAKSIIGDTMKDLKVRLEQAKRDCKISVETFGKEIVALEKQIAEAEVTYSIGDRFNDLDDKVKAMLASVGPNKVCMIALDDGNRYVDPVKVKNSSRVTEDEMESVCTFDDFVRYWDNRKQENC